MDKIKACVSDVLATANSVAWQALSQAKRRLELLFADAPGSTASTLGAARDPRSVSAQGPRI
jgi:hypothetical protein